LPLPMPFARSHLPLPARRALLRVRYVPKNARQSCRFNCRPRPTSDSSWIGLEGVDPRHHRGGAASTRLRSTGLPLLRSAVPRTPQPVARPISSRGCAVQRASSLQRPTPRRGGCPACRSTPDRVWTERLFRFPGLAPSLHRCLSTGPHLKRCALSHSALSPTLAARPLTRPKPARFVSSADRLQGFAPPTSP
jgi:hypothetical protein